MFESFTFRNYRYFFASQAASLFAQWMYTVAFGWVAFQVSHSGLNTGISIALQYAPLLFFGLWGGVIADVYDRRVILLYTQTAFSVLAFTLAFLAYSGHATLVVLFALSLCVGVVRIVDDPARNSLLAELVPQSMIKNAVSLRSSLSGFARIMGTVLGGILLAVLSPSNAFFVIGLLYGVSFWCMWRIRPSDYFESQKSVRSASYAHIRNTIRYVVRVPELYVPLVIGAVLGTFAYTFQVTFPLLTSNELHGGPFVFSLLFSCIGGGAIFGSLYAAHHKEASIKHLSITAAGMGMAIMSAGSITFIPVLVVFVLCIGFFGTNAAALAMTLLQKNAKPEERGVVMSIWSIVFIGFGAFGYPLVGWVSGIYGAHVGLWFSGAIVLVVSLFFLFKNRLL